MKKQSLFGNLFMLLILVALVYLWFPRKSHQVLWTDKTLGNFFRPAQEFFGGVASYFTDIKTNTLFLRNAAKENVDLKAELATQKLKTWELQQQLLAQSGLLKVQAQHPHKRLLPVQIVSEDPFVASKSVMIDAGQNQGVMPNAVVVASEGLVGRILKVFPNSSQAILITDPHFRVDAMSLKSNNRIILRGVDSDLLWGKGYPFLNQAEFLLHAQSFENGEELVTSGFGGIYPKGVPVGKIMDIKANSSGLFSEAEILPAVDFMKNSALFILLD